ncbi:MAG: hypothetical protein J6X18_03730 [Bacteroidales bacterium]|nr:hypothetical protein [Bacteroidales bacterium]
MKKFLTLFVFGVLVSFATNAQYTETKDVTPLGFSGNFEFLQYSKTRGLLALSNKSILYVSSDTAKTWETEKLPLDTINYFVMHSDGLVGFIKNKNTVYRTTDGSLSWEQMPLEGISKKIDGYEVVLERIHFKTRDTLFLVLTNKVNGKRIYKSSDCGVSWKEVAKDIQPRYTLLSGFLNNIHWRNENEGYFYGQGQFVKTIDGGDSWTMVNYSDAEYEKINWLMCSYKNGTAIIAEQQNSTNRLFFSKDGNPQNRENVLLLNIGEKIQEVNGVLYAVQGDYLWQSIDSAKTWNSTLIKEGANITSQGMYFYDNNVGVTISKNLTSYVTTDGGKTWTKYVYGGAEGFNDIYAKNERECFLIGKTGRIFHTMDGGKTWIWQDLYITGLSNMTFPSQDTGYVISNDILLMTADGGKTWVQKANKHGGTLIDFVTPQIGFVGFVPNVAYLAKTTDAGDSWVVRTNKTYRENVNPYSFDFRNESEGLVTGKGNLLLYTTDGGQTWEIKETVPNNYYVWSVQNVADKGWLVSVGDEDFYGIFFCDNDFNCQLVFEGDGSDNSARYIICVNDSVYYQPINNTHYISRDYGLTWEDADFDITGQRSFANEHLAYSFDFDYNIHKTYINVRNMGITITQVQNRQLEIATDIVENISANVYLKDANGNSYSLFSSYEIKKDVPFTINIPHNIPQGTYRLFIESLNSAYKDTESDKFEDSEETAVLDISKNQTYRVQGKTLYIYDSKAKLYTVLGTEIPIQNGVAELKAGVYILQTTQGREKVVVR